MSPIPRDVSMDSTTGNQYLYDGEGRVCAVESTSAPGFTTMTGYIYDADGNRVAKGTITSLSCDTTQNGFQPGTDYVLGPGGEPVTELAEDSNGTMQWQQTYVYAGSALIGTYDPNPDTPSQPLLSFRLTDWVGTMRATTDANGVAQGACAGLPFGDGQACQGNIPDPHYFTGKERDPETGGPNGNDYFGARYYASSMARWLSPDWSAKVEPVPYAKMDDPQSLNLYAYVGNNPLTTIDQDGHGGSGCQSSSAQVGSCQKQSAVNKGGTDDGQEAQQQSGPTAKVKGNTVTYTYPDGSKVVLKGDHPFRDNNPGDLRSGHGSIGRDGGFAIYPSLQAGVDALGATLTGKYGDSSIADTMKAFAPASDGNDPVKYAATLASAVGVPASTKISALSSAQLMTFQYTIANAEGYSAAGNTASYTAPPQ